MIHSDTMKYLFPLCLLSFLLVFGWGCGGESTTTGPDIEPGTNIKTPEGPESIAEDIPFDPDAIYLERMYATSVGEAGPEYLLDGDPATTWQAIPGAGPNEGVMLYFENPIEVGSVTIRSAPNGNAVKGLECFINGADAGKISLDTEKKIDEEVQSMFVRITKVAGQEEIEFGEYPFCTIINYPPDALVSLAEIEFKDKAGNPLKVRPLHLEAGVVNATSVLEPAQAYNADFLFDSNLEFGWAEGQEDEGVGEKIQFTFDRAIRIEKIKVWNGYQRSKSHFERNARAKEVAFAAMGANGEGFELPDQQGGSVIDLANPIEGNEFEFRINSFYPGESYRDLLISEFRFFDGRQWFGLASNGAEERKAALKNEVGNSFLSSLLDRNFYEFQDMEIEGDVSYSLTLRSSGSFVLYRNRSENSGSDTEKSTEIREVADGNWSIESLDAGKEVAKIKIFGKLNRIMEKEYWYKGNTKSDMTRIFSEILTITPDKIKGQKLIDEMHLRAPAGENSDATGSSSPDPTKTLRYIYPGSEWIPEFQVTLEV